MTEEDGKAQYFDEAWFKLARRIFRSSIWEEDPATRIVWITLLHLAQLPENRKHGAGTVLITRGNLTREAFVTAEQLEHALARLTAPDPTSRTEPDRGRIDVLPNGYRIRSFERYHDAEEYAAWRAQRVAAGKARAEKARRKAGRIASETPATAGDGTSEPLDSHQQDETETRRDRDETETTNGTEPASSDSLDTRTGDEPEREELLVVCRAIATRLDLSLTTAVKRVAGIPASNGHAAKEGFADPRAPGISIEWVKCALARARELAAELERPVPL